MVNYLYNYGCSPPLSHHLFESVLCFLLIFFPHKTSEMDSLTNFSQTSKIAIIQLEKEEIPCSCIKFTLLHSRSSICSLFCFLNSPGGGRISSKGKPNFFEEHISTKE